MKIDFQLHFDEPTGLSARNIRELQGFITANRTAIIAAMGAAFVTEVNTTLGFVPTLPTMTRGEIIPTYTQLDVSSTRRAQTYRASRDS